MQKKNFLKFKKYLLNNFIKIQGVESINLVGSFWSKPNSSNYSDIDIVIILDKFSLKKLTIVKISLRILILINMA